MEQQRLRDAISLHGDVVITYISPVSKKRKYIVATGDFNNRHIASKERPVRLSNNKELVFAWDADSFKQIDASSVLSVVPLSRILNNDS